MTRVAIVGAGAIGATVGAWLEKRQDFQVVICVRTPFTELRVITPRGVLISQPEVVARPAQLGPIDWVIVATKTYDASGARAWLEVASSSQARVAVLQNGVEHLSRFSFLPAHLTVPAIVDIPAERSAPGQVLQRRDGSILVPAGPAGEAFAALFAHTPIDVRTTDDWLTAAWRKLAINCAGAVNALTLQPARIASDPEVAELMRALVRECIAVGRREGADLPDSLCDEVVEGYWNAPPDSINSVHADRLAGRTTEADARNGVIARLGAIHGIDAPLNRMADLILRHS